MKISKSCILVVLLQISYHFNVNYKSTRICIIGAGIAGLTSAKYLKEEGINFTVFEATRYVGGTWRYDPRTRTDENGMPLHTSMYKNLRTNLPKPTMELRGFPLPEYLPSYPSRKDYYHYLQNYAKHYGVVEHIKFLHNVILVSKNNNKWKVQYQHVVTKEVFEEDFDYVLVCNGHNSKPNMPNITGENLFKGTIIHSHDYRKTDPYKNRRVLIVGTGPSGVGIGWNVAEVGKYLIHSHHNTKHSMHYPPNYLKKPDIKEFNETGAIFIDGTFEEVDDVIYCTGFENDYSFLDESCGLTLTPQFVYPLYRHMVNIREPSMIIMGLVTSTCVVVTLDAQARYVAALIKGSFTLPSEYEMMQEWEDQMAVVSANNLRPSFMHALADKEDEYYAALTAESGIDRVLPVMFKIRKQSMEEKRRNYYTFRDYEYIVIDNNTFTKRQENKLKRKIFNKLIPTL